MDAGDASGRSVTLGSGAPSRPAPGLLPRPRPYYDDHNCYPQQSSIVVSVVVSVSVSVIVSIPICISIRIVFITVVISIVSVSCVIRILAVWPPPKGAALFSLRCRGRSCDMVSGLRPASRQRLRCTCLLFPLCSSVRITRILRIMSVISVVRVISTALFVSVVSSWL